MKKHVSIILSVIALFASVQTVHSQSSDWDAVRGLGPETRVVVQLKGGRVVKGRARSTDADSLSVVTGRAVTRIPREEVYRVYLGKKGSRTGGALIGALIGGGIGVGAAVLYERNTTNGDGLAGAAGILYGVPIGAGIGAAAGGGTKKSTLIYQAP